MDFINIISLCLEIFLKRAVSGAEDGRYLLSPYLDALYFFESPLLNVWFEFDNIMIKGILYQQWKVNLYDILKLERIPAISLRLRCGR